MTDKQGNGYQEEKSFVVYSRAPKLSFVSQPQTARTGEELLVRVTADRDAMRIVARIMAAPVQLAWSKKRKPTSGGCACPPDWLLGNTR